MKTVALLIILGMVIFSSHQASACTGMGLYLTQPSPYFSSDGPKTGTYSVVVSGNTTGGACSYFVTLDYGSGSSYSTRAFRLSGAEWPYQLYRDAGGLYVLKKVPDATSCSDVLCGNLAAGSHNISQSQSYSIIIMMRILGEKLGVIMKQSESLYTEEPRALIQRSHQFIKI